MVAIVSGNTLGLSNSSLDVLGKEQGSVGQAEAGRSGERVYVDASSGNLVIQREDDVLMSHGIPSRMLRTYNSQAVVDGDNNDGWRAGFIKRLSLSGAVNAAGSTITRTDGDGADIVYAYDATAGLYLGTGGDGAYDTIAYDAAANKWTWKDGQTLLKEDYDDRGTITRAVDLAGNQLTYSYSASMVALTTSSGETTRLYYSGNQLTQVSEVTAGMESTRVRYAYDTAGRLSAVTVDLTPEDGSIADGKVYQTLYTYDGTSNRVATLTQTDGTQLSFTYVLAGSTYKVQTVTDALGHVTRFTYNAGNTWVDDPLNLRTVVTFDTAGQLTGVTSPAVNGVAATTAIAYDANGNVTRITDGEGRFVDYEYDAAGNRILDRDSLGDTVTRSFAGTLLKAETRWASPDADGAGTVSSPSAPLTTRYIYDSALLLRYTITPEGRVTRYEYTPYGERSAAIQYTVATFDLSPYDAFAAPTFDAMESWKAAIADKSQVFRTDYTYDLRGQLHSSTVYEKVDATGAGIPDGTESTTRYLYDPAGRLVNTILARQTTSGVEVVTTYTYDGLDRVRTASNGLGEITVTDYDDAFRRTMVTRASGLSTTSFFDVGGELRQLSDSTAAASTLGTTSYFHDADGRLRETRDPTGVRHLLVYDEAGRKSIDIDGDGSMTELVYDRSDRVVQTIRYLNRANLAAIVDATTVTRASLGIVPNASDRVERSYYDTAGRLVRKLDAGNFATDYVYDGASRLLEEIRYANAATLDAAGKASVVPDAANDRHTRNVHDRDGLLTGTVDGDGYLTEYKYDAAGRNVETVRHSTPDTTAPGAKALPAAAPSSGPRTNFAAAAAGATATASSSYSAGFLPKNAIDGVRAGGVWGTNAAWNDGTVNSFPDWLQVDFRGMKTIDQVVVYSAQDTLDQAPEPADTTLTSRGLVDFTVEAWNGAQWVVLATITNNDLAKRSVSFAGFTTDRIRVNVTRGGAGYSGITELEAWGTEKLPGSRNVAAAGEGAVATASSVLGAGFDAFTVNDGDRKGTQPWGQGAGWLDGTPGAYPDWVQVDFAGTKTINEVSVFMLQDALNNPSDPTNAMTFVNYGLTDFRVEGWDGQQWVTLATVANNNLVRRTVSFDAFTTDRIRIDITRTPDGYSHMVELEAWGVDALPGSRNVALAAEGARATASRSQDANFLPYAINNGDRTGAAWGQGGDWLASGTPDPATPDWVQVDFNGTKIIDHITLFSVQDNIWSTVEPSPYMTFTLYGAQDFTVQGWNGTTWVTLATVTGNNLVRRNVNFAAFTTDRIRVNVTRTPDGYKRVAELQAWGVDALPNRRNVALASAGGVASASSFLAAGYDPSTVINGDHVGTAPWGSGDGWLDGTPSVKPDWIQVNFAGQKTIDQVTLYMLQDAFATAVEPTNDMTFGSYGLTDFTVDGWDGTKWVNLAAVAGNNLVKKSVTFAAFTTDRVRVNITKTPDPYSHLVELEAWGVDALVNTTNVAAASAGATAVASSQYSDAYPVSAAIDGDRAGVGYSAGGVWMDANNAVYPDYLQVNFNGVKTIDNVVVYSLQDAYMAPSQPTDTMTFANYGLADFAVQGWNGATWVTLGTVSGNNLVKRTVRFGAFTTDRIRIKVLKAGDGWSRLVEVEANGVAADQGAHSLVDDRRNVALASAGAVATASSVWAGASGFSAANAINGDAAGVNWGPTGTGGWQDFTPGTYPDWLQVAFNGTKIIDNVVVYSVQDNWQAPSQPTDTMTFTNNGLIDFTVEGWNGSSWVTLGTVTGNDLVKRRVDFAPFMTDRIRINVTRAAVDNVTRIVEVEAWGVDALTNTSNVAAASAGASASASTTVNANFLAAGAIDGDRAGLKWGANGGWNDGTLGVFPDYLTVNFNGLKTIDNVVVYTVQDAYNAPGDPTDTMTFTSYGVVDFDVEGWNGTAWVTLGSVVGNNLVKRRVAFGAFTTDRIRIRVNKAADGFSRITEVEAYGIPADQGSTNFASQRQGGNVTVSSIGSGADFRPSSLNNGEVAGVSWREGGGWRDDTVNRYGDWAQVDFAGAKTIDRVVVYSTQDNIWTPSQYVEGQTFGTFGARDFTVQGWDGANWVTLATVTGNNLVKRTVTFAGFTTDRIRVSVMGAPAGDYTRLTEIEAWGRPAAAAASTMLKAATVIAANDDIHDFVLYNLKGQVAAKVDGEGSLTEFLYDKDGNVCKQIRYATRVTYTAGASLASVRPLSTTGDRITDYTYDALNRVQTEHDPDGLTTTYAYDHVGHLVSTTRTPAIGEKRTLTSRFDVQGRLIGELDARGSATLTGNETAAQVDALFAAYGTRYTYDAAGRRTSATDASWRRTLYFYNIEGLLSYKVDGEGGVEHYEYDEFNELKATTRFGTSIASSLATLSGGAEAAVAPLVTANVLTDAIQRLFYNSRGLVGTAHDQLGNDRNYTYNAFGEESVCDEPGATSARTVKTLEYDRRGLLTRETRDVGGLNLLTRTDYDAFGRATQVTQGSGFHAYAYDKAGRVITVTDPAGTQATAYDAFGRVFKVRDGLGLETTYAYGTNDATVTTANGVVSARILTITTPEGIQTRTYRDAFGETVEVDDGNGRPTVFTYDADGNLVQTDAQSEIVVRTFDQTNLQVDERRKNDASGAVTHFKYDAARRLIERTVDYDTTDTSRLNLKTVTTYDAKGQVIAVTDPNGVKTQYQWDARGQLLTQTVDPDGLGLQTTYAYDSRGDVISVTQPNNTLTRYEYDNAGRRFRETVAPTGGATPPLNLVTTYDFNERDQVVAVKDPRGSVTRYIRDAADRVIYTVNALGEVQETQYDADSRVTRITQHTARIDAASLTGASGPGDVAIKLSAAISSAGATLAPSTVENRLYDHDGRLRFVVNALNEVSELRYDGNGNVVDHTIYASRLAAGTVLSTDSLAAAVAFLRDPSHDQRTRTVYDAANRAIYTVDGTGAVTQRFYDFRNNVTMQVSYANRLSALKAGSYAILTASDIDVAADAVLDRRETNNYDNAGRLYQSTDGVGAITTRSYDRNGNLKTITQGAAPLPAGIPPNVVLSADRVESFFYDSANRLVDSVDGAGSVTRRAYDGAGNVISRTRFATAVVPTAVPVLDGRVAVAASALDIVEKYTYDSANRLSASMDGMGAVTGYVYDANGNEVRRIAYATLVSPAAGPGAVVADAINDRIIRRAVYDIADRLLWQLDATGAAVKNVYDAKGNVVVRIAYAMPMGDLSPTADPAFVTAPFNNFGTDRVQRHVFDAANREIYSVDAMGFVRRTNYDGAGNTIDTTAFDKAVALPAGGSPAPGAPPVSERPMTAAEVAAALVASLADRKDTYLHDAAGRVTSHTDAEGATESYSYDGLGNRRTFTNKRGFQWIYAYDRAGRLLREDTPVVNTTQLARDASGNLVATTTSGRLTTLYVYDGLGQLVSRTDSDRTTYYEYDKAGRQVRTVDPQSGAFDASLDGTGGTGIRPDAASIPDTVVTYDVFGNAVVNRDVGGNFSYKVYDKAGRVHYEVDAEGGVTEYTRNAFGDAIHVTRYAATFNAGVGAGQAQAESTIAGFAAFVPSGRTVTTVFDAMGRARSVSEPAAFVYAPGTTLDTSVDVARTTVITYDAFGEVIFTGTVIDPRINLVSGTQSFYDRRGNKTLEIDTANYATQYSYDAAGDIFEKRELAAVQTAAQPLLNSTQLNPPALVFTPSQDRLTRYTYDRLGRKIAETRVGVAFTDNDVATAGDVITSYTYDAVGNLTSTTDATGAVTYTYYDTLGRTIVVASPSRAGDLPATPTGTPPQLTPITEFKVDAHGNVVQRIDYAAGGTANAFGYAMTPGVDDRTTFNEYDVAGHLLDMVDPTGQQRNFSYDAFGHVMKQWERATNNGAAGFIVRSFTYDHVGRQVSEADFLAPGVKALKETVYNKFGEVVSKRMDGVEDEFFDYDASGRVWRTNTGDGVTKVYFRDVLGNVSAEITAAAGGTASDLRAATITSARGVYNQLSLFDRTEYQRDVAGNVVQETKYGASPASLVNYVPDPGTLGVFRNLEEYWIGFLKNPAGFSQPWTNGTLIRGDGNNAIFRDAAGADHPFAMSRGPLAVMHDDAAIRDAIIAAYGSFSPSATALIPNDLAIFRQMEKDYDEFFANTTGNFPVNTTLPWMGGTLRKDSSTSATYTDPNGVAHTLNRSDSLLDVMRGNPFIETGWQMQYGIRWLGAGGESFDLDMVDFAASTTQLTPRWHDIGFLGAGDVKVTVQYRRDGAAGSVTGVFSSEAGATGVNFDLGPASASPAIIDRVTVWKKDVGGNWQQLLDQQNGQGTLVPTLITVPVPADETAAVSLEVRPAGATSWISALAPVNFGDRLWFHSLPAAGNAFDYHVQVAGKDIASGSMVAQVPLLTPLTGSSAPVLSPDGIMTWGDSSQLKVFDPNAPGETLRARAVFLTLDTDASPNAYLQYRQLEEDTYLFFTDKVHFPAGTTIQNWLYPGAALNLDADNVAHFTYNGNDFTFTVNDTPLEIAWRNPLIRAGWTTQYPGLAFKDDPDGYFPNILNQPGQRDEGQGWHQMDISFDDFFNVSKYPPNTTLTWWVDPGVGTATLRKNQDNSATFLYNNVAELTFSKADGPLKVLKLNSRIRAHWSVEHNLTLAQSPWVVVDGAGNHAATFNGIYSNGQLKYPAGRYQYELVFDRGLKPFAHAVGTVDVPATGFHATSATAYSALASDTNLYWATQPAGSVRAWQVSATQPGYLLRASNNAVTGAADSIAYVVGGYSTLDSTYNFDWHLQNDADMRNGWSLQYGDPSHPQAIYQRVVSTPTFGLVQAEMDTAKYFNDLADFPVGSGMAWGRNPANPMDPNFHGWLYKVDADTAYFYGPNGEPAYVFTRWTSVGRIFDDNAYIRAQWYADYGVGTVQTTRWAAWNLDLEAQMRADTNLFLTSPAYAPGNARLWFGGTASEGLLVKGANNSAYYVKGAAGGFATLRASDNPLVVAETNAFFRDAWLYQYSALGLQFAGGREGAFSQIQNLNPGTAPLSLPLSDPSLAPIVTSSIASAPGVETISIQRTFDRWGNTLSETDARNTNWSTRYTYNANNQVTESGKYQFINGGWVPIQAGAVDAAGTIIATTGSTKVAYDKLGRAVAVTDANGNTNRFRYDKAGDVTAEIHADGGVINYAYDVFGDQTVKRDTLLHITSMGYDKDGRLKSQAFAAAAVYRMDATSQLPTLDSASFARTESYVYDEAGRRKATMNGNGETTLYELDAFGNITKETLAGGQVTTTQWDHHGHRIAETNADGDSQAWHADAFGRMLDHTDLAGNTTQYTYDKARRLARVTKTQAGSPSTVLQNLVYSYDGFGRLVRTDDTVEDSITTDGYDKAGNKISEQFVKNGITYQDNHLTYDGLGRMTEVLDERHHVWLSYDAAGNRREIRSFFIDDAGALGQSDNWYLYDSMNRMTVENGVRSGAAIDINTVQGVQYRYDTEGNRLSARQKGTKYVYNGSGSVDTSWASPYVTENYYYDAENRLVRSAQESDVGVGTDRYGNLWNTTALRMYDRAGREEGDYNHDLSHIASTTAAGGDDGADTRQNTYDASGRLLRTVAIDYKNGQRYNIDYTRDGVGNVQNYRLEYRLIPASNHFIDTYTYTYKKDSAYHEQSIALDHNDSSGDHLGRTDFLYDANGNLARVLNSMGGDTKASDAVRKNRFFINDTNGAVLARVDGLAYDTAPNMPLTPDRVSPGVARIRHSLVVDGQTLGISAEALNQDAQVARFDFGAQGGQGVGGSPSYYVLTDADHDMGLASLRRVAQAVYGDSSLWFVIAEANGLNKDADVVAGLTIAIPSGVTSNKNDFRTFKPYDQAEIRGDNQPIAPMPQGHGGGCGTMGQLLVAVVAAAAAIVTFQYEVLPEIAAAAEASGDIAASSAAVLETPGAFSAAVSSLPTSTVVQAAMVSGAASNIAGQLAANATGIQRGFSEKSFVASVASAGITAGIAPIAGLGAPDPVAVAARAALNAAVNQGVNIAVGQQKQFNWTAVAASALAAPLAERLSAAVGSQLGQSNVLAATIAQNFAYGVVQETAVKLAGGGRIKWENIAADAFGNALGQSIGQIDRGSQTETALADAEQRTGLRMPLNVGTGLGEDLGLNPMTVDARGYGAFGGGPLAVPGADPLTVGNGEYLLASDRTRTASVSVGGGDVYIPVAHRGTLDFDDPRVPMQWDVAGPGGLVKPLAKELIDGGARYHYTNGYLDDLTGIGAKFVPQQLSTRLELLPNAIDAMRERYGVLTASGANSSEQAELADYFGRFSDALAAGDRETMQAALASDVKAFQGGNTGLANRIIGLGTMIDPNGAWANIPRLDRSLAEFTLTSATGVLAMFTGGWAFGAATRAGFSLLGAGATAGFVGDATIQAADNAVFAATRGNYGRSGVNVLELGVSTGLGALPGASQAVRGLAEDLRALGLPDWRISMARPSPGTLYTTPLPMFEFERIALPLGLRGDSRTLGLNMGTGTVEGYANHHLIMTSLAQESDALRSLAERGLYDVNRASNGLQLPTNEYLALSDQLPLHAGFHGREYRLAAESELTRLDEAYRLGASDSELLTRVGRIEQNLRSDLLSGRIWLNDPDAALRRLGGHRP